jgi:hypothetical protein
LRFSELVCYFQRFICRLEATRINPEWDILLQVCNIPGRRNVQTDFGRQSLASHGKNISNDDTGDPDVFCNIITHSVQLRVVCPDFLIVNCAESGTQSHLESFDVRLSPLRAPMLGSIRLSLWYD